MPRSLTIDIRNVLLETGRIVISSRTTSKKEYTRRKSAVNTLIDRGRVDLVERLRDGDIHIAAVADAVFSGDYSKIERASSGTTVLSTALNRIVARAEGSGVDGTVRQKKSMRRAFLAAFDCTAEVHTIASEQIEAFLFGPKTSGKPWGPVRQEEARQMGMQAWDIAIADEAQQIARFGGKPRLVANPWRGIRIAGGGKNKMKRVAFLSRAEWLAIESANKGHPELAFVAIGCLAGLRAGEVRHLRRDVDVDMDRRLIRIQPREGKLGWKPKTPRSIRVVPMNDRLHAILVDHIAKGFAGERYLTIIAKRDRPMNETAAMDWTARAFRRGGVAYGRKVEGYTNHTLRHTFASWLVQDDVQLKKVAELLGDSTKTVDDVYAHLLPTDMDQTVRRIDRKLEAE